MFKDKTLFIIGAGASAEFDLPVGKALAMEIKEKSKVDFNRYTPSKGDRETIRWLRNRFRTDSELVEVDTACRDIYEGIYSGKSIDNFIDRRRDNPRISEIGKMLIANSILRAENNSKLSYDRSNIYNCLELDLLGKTWIDPFFDILIQNVDKDEINKIGKAVSIICFNYDRCIEFYLIEALRKAYSIEYVDAHEIVFKMNIIHPYGLLGGLPNSPSASTRENSVRFGGDELNDTDPWPISERIKTYTEQVAEPKTVSQIRKTVSEAKQIVFLGFSFQPQNMVLMKPDEKSKKRKTIFATGRGISKQEVATVKTVIVNWYSNTAGIHPDWVDQIQLDSSTSCFDVMVNNSRNLLAV